MTKLPYDGNGDDSLNILVGAAAIAKYLYGHEKYRRRVYYLASKKTKFPCFVRAGARIHALKGELRKFFSGRTEEL